MRFSYAALVSSEWFFKFQASPISLTSEVIPLQRCRNRKSFGVKLSEISLFYLSTMEEFFTGYGDNMSQLKYCPFQI